MAAALPASRNTRRRRQRSVRVTVAVGLLGLATVGVLAALPTRSALWLGISSVAAIVLAWAALRMMWTEVLQSRRVNAADRAAAASAYRSLFSVRAAEHAEFTTAMTERLAEAHLSQRELEGQVAQTETQLVESRSRIVALEQELAVREADDVDSLAVWEASTRPSRPALVKEA
jgi:hypothetical protein